MKKLLLFLFLVSIGYSQTRTSNFQLPQWTTGDTLKAGTKNDTLRANFSINNGLARLDAIVGRRLDSAGNHKSIGGSGTGNLDINAGVLSGTPVRVTVSDSLYGYYNWQTEGNLLVQGNATIGGYIVIDSVQTTSLWLPSTLTTGGDIISYGDIGTVDAGTISSDGTITANNDILSSESLTIGENVGGWTITSGNQVKMYVKGDKFIIAYNDGGTYKYRYLDLTSTNATWTYTTTEP